MTGTRFNLARMALVAAWICGTTAVEAATVAYYKFENGTADTAAIGRGTILDSSGNGLDGTPHRKPRYMAVSNPGSTLALHFNGTFARVHVPDDPLFHLTHSLTLEAYVYIEGLQNSFSQIVFRGDDRADLDPYFMCLDPEGRLVFRINDSHGHASLVASPSALPQRQWMHVAATLDDGTGEQAVYVNGSLVASTITSLRPFAHLDPALHPGLGIGALQDVNSTSHFHGNIDDVRISDVALDPSQFLPPP